MLSALFYGKKPNIILRKKLLVNSRMVIIVRALNFRDVQMGKNKCETDSMKQGKC